MHRRDSDFLLRFRELDQLMPPRPWPDIETLGRRGEIELRPKPERGWPDRASERPLTRRVAAGVVAISLFAGAGLFAWLAFHPGGRRDLTPVSPGPPSFGGRPLAGTETWPQRVAGASGHSRWRCPRLDGLVLRGVGRLASVW